MGLSLAPSPGLGHRDSQALGALMYAAAGAAAENAAEDGVEDAEVVDEVVEEGKN